MNFLDELLASLSRSAGATIVIAPAIAAMAWLLRERIGNHFKAYLDRQKAELEKSTAIAITELKRSNDLHLERLRNDLQRETQRELERLRARLAADNQRASEAFRYELGKRQQAFTEVYRLRAAAFIDLHRALRWVENAVLTYTAAFQPAGVSADDQRRDAVDSILALFKSYADNGLLIPEELCHDIDEALKQTKLALIKMDFARLDSMRGRIENQLAAIEHIETQFPVLRRKIKREMEHILLIQERVVQPTSAAEAAVGSVDLPEAPLPG